MTEFLHDTLSQKQNILTQNDHRSTVTLQNVEEMTKEQKIELIYDLLKQIQPYLSAGNLTVIPPPKMASSMAPNNGLNGILQNIKVKP